MKVILKRILALLSPKSSASYSGDPKKYVSVEDVAAPGTLPSY